MLNCLKHHRLEKGLIIKDIATSSSTLNELEAYFGVGQTVSATLKVDEEENH